MSRTTKLFAGVAAVAVTTTTALASAGATWADPPAPSPPMNPLATPGITAVEQLSPVIQQAALNPQSAVSLLTSAAAALAGNAGAPDDSRRVASSVDQFVREPASPDPNPGSLLPSADIHLPGALPGLPVPLPSGVSLPSDLSQLLPPGLALPGPGFPSTADPAAHIPAAGAVPGGEAHLPAGTDPAHAVGPPPQAAPVAAPTAAVPAPDAAPAPAAPSAPAAAPAGETPPAAAPAATPAPAPAADPAPAPASTPAPAPDAAAAPGGDAQPPAPAFGPDAPPTQDFMYPSIGTGCLADGSNSLATAIAVAGPARSRSRDRVRARPLTCSRRSAQPAPAEVQKLPLNVTWINLTTGKSGTATMKPNPEINPNGPTTLVAIVDTGSGSILSTIFGQVTTTDKQCGFMPTIGSTVVP